MGPAGGGVVPGVVVPAVWLTLTALEAVVVLRFLLKYQMAAPTIASGIKIHNQLNPPLSEVGTPGAGVAVV